LHAAIGAAADGLNLAVSKPQQSLAELRLGKRAIADLPNVLHSRSN
jgi:hypothetical protein